MPYIVAIEDQLSDLSNEAIFVNYRASQYQVQQSAEDDNSEAGVGKWKEAI